MHLRGSQRRGGLESISVGLLAPLSGLMPFRMCNPRLTDLGFILAASRLGLWRQGFGGVQSHVFSKKSSVSNIDSRLTSNEPSSLPAV
jgi:hypothetical protein